MERDEGYFKKLLGYLMSSEDNTRILAKMAYESLPTDSRLMCLLDVITSPENAEDLRLKASVLMEGLITTGFDRTYSMLSSDKQGKLKDHVLTLIQNEQSANIRKRACEVTGLLACKLLDGGSANNRWPDFPECLFSWLSCPSSELRQAALDIFAAAPGMFGTQYISCYYQQLAYQLLFQGLTDPMVSVQMAATRAAFCFARIDECDDSICDLCDDLLPRLLRSLVSSVGKAEGSVVIQCLVDLIGKYPTVLAIHGEAVKQACLGALEGQSVPDAQRGQLLEVVRKLSG